MEIDHTKSRTEFASRLEAIMSRNLVFHLIPPITLCIISIILSCCFFRGEFYFWLSFFSALIALLHGIAVLQFFRRAYSNSVASHAFDRLINVIPQVHWIRKGKQVAFISPSYETVWESTCDVLCSDPETFFQNIHPDDLHSVRRSFESNRCRGSCREDRWSHRPRRCRLQRHARGDGERREPGAAYRHRQGPGPHEPRCGVPRRRPRERPLASRRSVRHAPG